VFLAKYKEIENEWSSKKIKLVKSLRW
jgi:hypothetical protein